MDTRIGHSPVVQPHRMTFSYEPKIKASQAQNVPYLETADLPVFAMSDIAIVRFHHCPKFSPGTCKYFEYREFNPSIKREIRTCAGLKLLSDQNRFLFYTDWTETFSNLALRSLLVFGILDFQVNSLPRETIPSARNQRAADDLLTIHLSTGWL